jgi:hypothetical protein
VKFESVIMRNVTNPIIIDQGNFSDLADSSEARVHIYKSESIIQ